MAFWYSNNFNYDTDGTFEPGRMVSSGITHGRRRVKRMYKDLTAATLLRTNGDELVLGTFKSGDRLIALEISTSANNAAGVVDLGLKRANLDHNPTTMPTIATAITDIFLDGLALSTALARTDAFLSATDLRNVDRGLALWELVNKKAAATFTADPQQDWDLILLAATGLSATACEVSVIADFVSVG